MRLSITIGGRHVAVLSGLMLLVLAGVAYAAVPDSRGLIHGCYVANGGLRVIDTEEGASCRRGETAIAWASSAPSLRCPEGMIASTGVCFESTSHAAAIHGDAEDECAADGMKLPSGGELTTFVELDGVELDRGHWTDDVADTNASGAFHYFFVADPGNGATEAFDELPFRCVTGPVLG